MRSKRPSPGQPRGHPVTEAGTRGGCTTPPQHPPQVPPLAQTPRIPIGGAKAPRFTQHVDFRPCWGRGPFDSGAAEQRFGGWTRPVEPTTGDAGLALLLLDAWPPAIFAGARHPVPAATVVLSAHFLRPIAPDPAWIVTVAGRATDEGYASQDNEVWSGDGRLLARAQQLFAVLAPVSRG